MTPNTTTAGTTSRLWPVLLTLVLLPVGATLIEQYAALRGGDERVIRVEVIRQADEDADDDLGAGAGAAAAAPEALAVAAARAHMREKNWPLAEAELRRALVQRPGYGPALRSLGRVLAAAGRPAEAIETLKQAAAFGSNEERAASLVSLGAALLESAQPTEARAAFDQAIERAPARVEIRLRIARAYLATDKKDDATRASGVLATAADLAPDLADVQSLIGQTREALGDVDGAEEAFRQAVRLAPQATLPRRRLLRIALDRQHFQKAQQQVDELIAIDANVPEHHFLAGLVAARQNDAAGARAHYHTAIDKAGGTYPEAYFNLGVLAKEQKQLDDAIAAYRTAIAQRIGYHAAENNLGLTLVASGRLDEAETVYKETLARTPSYAPAWVNLGKLYSQRKLYPQAIDAYQKALAARPDYARALLDLGVAYARSGRDADAVATYRRVIAINPRSVAAWYNLGLAEQQRSDARAAERAFRSARELDPDHVASGKRLAAILSTTPNGEFEARALYEDLLDEDPTDVDTRLSHAELLRRAGDLTGCARDAAFARKSADPNTAAGRAVVELAAAVEKACSRTEPAKPTAGGTP